MKKNNYSIELLISFTFLVFLWPLITLQQGFLGGDSYQQFYPWLKTYSQAIKHFEFPFWVREMQSGYPLVAEGQVGAFYPLNIILFFLLPFNLAYNYSIIISFVIGGVFTYLYLRKLGASKTGAYISLLLFCFGSAYAGCFYNIVTLRTLCWFPVVLLLFERFLEKKQLIFILGAGIVIGLQFLAGFVQMAFYCCIFYAIYLCLKAQSLKFSFARLFNYFCIIFGIGLLVALPQLKLTLELVKFTARENATLGFALWKSFNPIGIFGLIFPFSFQSIASSLYIGVFSLFFVAFAFLKRKTDTDIRISLVLLLASLFFALGSFNPLYVLLLKITKFYSFRNPSKFLFFSCFYFSVLAGIGFSRFFEKNEADNTEIKAIRLFRWIILSGMAGFISIGIVFKVFKAQIIALGEGMVKKFILNKPFHRHSLETYLDKTSQFYQNIVNNFSLQNIFIIISWIIAILALVYLPVLLKQRRKNIVVGIIFIDLFIFSLYGSGFRGNFKSFDSLKPDCPKIFQMLRQDKDIFRILPLGLSDRKLPNWAQPNANMLYKIDSVACYTPLASNIYRSKLIDFEVVDDSLGLRKTNYNALSKNLTLLKLLNVKFIVSDKKLSDEFLIEEIYENGVYLYKIMNFYPRVFFVKDISNPLSQGNAGVEILKYSSGLIEVTVNVREDGYLIFSEWGYPGWRAYIEGKEESILIIDSLVQAIKINRGKHQVVFKYQPYSVIARSS